MTVKSEGQASVRLERRFEAPPDRVYEAWLDPDLARRWLSPGETGVAAAEIEARVGGCYRIWHEDGGVPIGGFDGEVVELVPAQRIVLRLGLAGPEREAGPVFDSRLTILLAEAEGGGTDLTLVHERLDDLRAARPEIADAVGRGWELALDKLDAACAGSDR